MYNISYITVKLFADDVKLYLKVVNTTDTDKLQSALAALVQWAEDWQLLVSVDKCCVLSISKGCTPAQFCINNIPLPVVDDYRDLGITVTKDLSPSKYISDIVKKAYCRTNMRMRHRCFVKQNALEVRKLKFDPIMCYKVIFGIVRVNGDEFFECTLYRTRGRTHDSLLTP